MKGGTGGPRDESQTDERLVPFRLEGVEPVLIGPILRAKGSFFRRGVLVCLRVAVMSTWFGRVTFCVSMVPRAKRRFPTSSYRVYGVISVVLFVSRPVVVFFYYVNVRNVLR